MSDYSFRRQIPFLVLTSAVSAIAGATLYALFLVPKADDVKLLPPKVAALLETTQTLATLRDSLNSIMETTMDQDDDGAVDTWVVSIRSSELITGGYVAKDTDGDRQPDEGSVSIGMPANVLMLGGRKDDESEKTSVALPSTFEPGKSFLYRDLDRDGRLDEMTQYQDGKAVDFFVLLGDCWVAADRIRGKSYEASATIEGNIRTVIFENGKWRTNQ